MKNISLINEFYSRYNKSDIPTYYSRESRNSWVASFIDKSNNKNILNLGGGGERYLEKYLGSNLNVHELDITGDCDTHLNLDEVNRLPFEDNSFDICCAFDVLEHLEEFHLITDEMFRVAKKSVLISLPNSTVELLAIFLNRKNYTDPLNNGVYSKFNGLPIKVPKDRHRWWLTFDDIIRYFIWFEKNNSCTVEFLIPINEGGFKRRLLKLIFRSRLYLNLFCPTVWIKIKRNL